MVVSLFLVAVTGWQPLAQACLWDWDTLQMERRRFPGVLEMITGKFVRHSLAYYAWRIRDRQSKLRSAAEDPAIVDDLAVALAKLKRHAEGIALLEEALAAHPDRYETLANLGTLHMLAGDLAKGKEYIDRAIEVNPDAHFGREKYQSLLAEYWLTARKTPPDLATEEITLQSKSGYLGFAKFVLEKRFPDVQSRTLDEINGELAAAQKGVLGMMHFADYDSPLLLEVLGDLLLAWPGYQQDAMHLAARAYYRVAQLTDDAEVKAQFEMAARKALEGNEDYLDWRRAQVRDKPEGTEWPAATIKLAADLDKELAEARKYVAKIEADEKQWIASGQDVDGAFAAKYYDSLDATIDEANRQLAREWRDVRVGPGLTERGLRNFLLGAGAFLIAMIVVPYLAYRSMRPGKRRRTLEQSAAP
jgi:tetratricopeptide (TPR) repeat protein